MCKLSSVSISTLLVELVSLVSLAFVSLFPLVSLVALSWLGDRVDIGLYEVFDADPPVVQ